MRNAAIPFMLLVVTITIASEEVWPIKDDTVYIASSFKKLVAPSLIGGAQVQYDMPPCAKLQIVKANQKKFKWVTKDPLGGNEKLEGAWDSRMHKSKEACEAQMSSEGEPKVIRSGEIFKIDQNKSK